MIDIRPAQVADLQSIQQANIANLPENYVFKFILYHNISWPQGSFVATNSDNQIVGYVLGKMEDDEAENGKDNRLSAHITSIAVNREYRRQGLARRLLQQSLKSLRENYRVEAVSLHVRESNQAAFKLYRDGLGFEVKELTKSYYADGEDAYSMVKTLTDWISLLVAWI